MREIRELSQRPVIVPLKPLLMARGTVSFAVNLAVAQDGIRKMKSPSLNGD